MKPALAPFLIGAGVARTLRTGTHIGHPGSSTPASARSPATGRFDIDRPTPIVGEPNAGTDASKPGRMRPGARFVSLKRVSGAGSALESSGISRVPASRQSRSVTERQIRRDAEDFFRVDCRHAAADRKPHGVRTFGGVGRASSARRDDPMGGTAPQLQPSTTRHENRNGKIRGVRRAVPLA